MYGPICSPRRNSPVAIVVILSAEKRCMHDDIGHRCVSILGVCYAKIRTAAMTGVFMQPFLVLITTAIATVLFYLGEHVGPDVVGHGVAHVAFGVEHSALHA